jgi:hypothetical protein
MNPALATISRVEPELALARRLAVRETRLKNDKPLSAAPHRAIGDSASHNLWPLISARSLIEPNRERKVSGCSMIRLARTSPVDNRAINGQNALGPGDGEIGSTVGRLRDTASLMSQLRSGYAGIAAHEERGDRIRTSDTNTQKNGNRLAVYDCVGFVKAIFMALGRKNCVGKRRCGEAGVKGACSLR